MPMIEPSWHFALIRRETYALSQRPSSKNEPVDAGLSRHGIGVPCAAGRCCEKCCAARRLTTSWNLGYKSAHSGPHQERNRLSSRRLLGPNLPDKLVET